MSPNSQEKRENTSGLKTKITKKDSLSAFDLRDTTGRGSHAWIIQNGRCEFRPFFEMF